MAGAGTFSESKLSNNRIENQLNREKKDGAKEIKLLLLGAGDSGKTTIARQFKIIHQDGFSPQERAAFRDIIQKNIFMNLLALGDYIDYYNGEGAAPLDKPAELTKLTDEMSQENIQLHSLDAPMIARLKSILAHPTLQEVLKRREFADTSVPYFFEQLDRFAGGEFVPTDDDILRTRVRTTGVKEMSFKIENTHFRLVDVGGQRSERKKWIHCFSDVKAILFCVALNEYDMKLVEDIQVNRMAEALALYEDICKNEHFLNTSVLLFLNKNDLFEKKILEVDLSETFPEYTGGKNYDNALEFIRSAFVRLRPSPQAREKVYPHVTCATSTDVMRKVFKSMQDVIVNEIVRGTGF